MTKPELIGEIDRGKVYVAYASLDKQIEDFERIGIKHPISARNTAYLRLHEGSLDGTRTCHAPIMYKDSPTILARVSPLVTDLNMAKQAVEAHRRNHYPSFGSEVYSEWEKIAKEDKGKKPENRRAMILSERSDYRFHRDSAEAKFLFQDTLKDYFKKFVRGDSIQSWQVSPQTIDSQDGTIVNYLWFCSVDVDSGLDFGVRGLGRGSRAFGVLNETPDRVSRSEKTVQSSSYSQREIDRALKLVKGVRAGNIPASKLEKVSGLLEKLKQ